MACLRLFRLGVGRLTEIRPEPIMGREPHIAGGRYDHVGHDAALQTAHPVGQHHTGHPAQDVEALRQQRQRRVRALVVGETHEPHPAPRQHRAEHVQPAQHTPIDDQMLTR